MATHIKSFCYSKQKKKNILHSDIYKNIIFLNEEAFWSDEPHILTEHYSNRLFCELNISKFGKAFINSNYICT